GVWYAAAAGTPDLLAKPIIATFAGMAPIGPTLFDLPVANSSYTWQDTVSWVKGRQAFKFGAQIVRNWDNKAITFQESLTFTTLDQFAANTPVIASTLGQPRMGMRNTYNHLFVQDDIQISPNLTINAGVRYQYDTTPTESHGRIANYNPATRDVDPE